MDTVKICAKQAKLIAHRGVSGIEKENTCPAFVAAGNRSYYGIETDVHVTRDGKFVIIHDETTDRITDGKYKINVEESDYSQVADIVLPDLDGDTTRQDIRIPLLKEYIKICKKYNKVCVLEVKNSMAKHHLESMVSEIKEAGYIDNVTFISFSLENCIALRDILPENQIQWLICDKKADDEMIKILVDNNLDLDIYYKMLDKESVEKLHSYGIKVNCWTCDDKAEAEELVSLGVDFITSNILE